MGFFAVERALQTSILPRCVVVCYIAARGRRWALALSLSLLLLHNNADATGGDRSHRDTVDATIAVVAVSAIHLCHPRASAMALMSATDAATKMHARRRNNTPIWYK